MSAIDCEQVGTFYEPRLAGQELWEDYRQRADTHAENALVEHYLPLVNAIRGRLAMRLPEHVDADDLHSAGLVGLLQALRNFNPACGISFEAYARVRVRGSMLDELRRMDWVPRTVHEKARKLQAALAALEQKFGRTPTDSELALALDMSVAEFSELRDEVRPATFLCLDSAGSAEDGDGGDLYEVVADATEDGIVEMVSQRELKEIVLARLQELPEMQRKVLTLYYREDLRLREIAEAFGLTESRICQIHTQAIQSIRVYLQQFEAGITRQNGPVVWCAQSQRNSTPSDSRLTVFTSWVSSN